jgi:hypothetical protein
VYAHVRKEHSATEKAVYSPLKRELDELKGELNAVSEAASKEQKGDGETGMIGVGPKTRALRVRRNTLAEKIKKLEPQVEPIKLSFEESEKNLEDISRNWTILSKEQKELEKSMERIFLADQSVLGKLPLQLINEKSLKIPAIQRTDYLPDYDKSIFLTPFNKIREKDESAIVSLIVASVIDLLALVLATAIDPHKSNIFRVTSHAVFFCILSFRKALITVYKAFNIGAEMFDVTEEESLNKVIRLTFSSDSSGTSGMHGTDFLRKFLSAVDMDTHVVNIHDLIEGEQNLTVKHAYRLLFDKILNHPSRWIDVIKETKNDHKEHSNGEVKKRYKISDKHYKSFSDWSSSAYHEQVRREDENPDIKGFIEISLPF